LPLGGRPVCLKVRVFQYQCEHCGRTWTPHCPIVGEGTWATARLIARAAELVRGSDVANAAAFFGIPEKTLERWYYDYVERQKTAADAAAQPIRSLGIDELSLKKAPSVRRGNHRPYESTRTGSAGKPGKSQGEGVLGGGAHQRTV